LTAIVLDASVTIAWALGEADPRAHLARARVQNGEAIVPRLWWFEIRNGLVVNERRGRFTELETVRFLRDLSQLVIVFDDTPDSIAVLTLARRHRLTVYDAAYLELALREAVPLATLDVALAVAARAENVPVLGD
jgi:predicted nucleic acid-binding protein